MIKKINSKKGISFKFDFIKIQKQNVDNELFLILISQMFRCDSSLRTYKSTMDYKSVPTLDYKSVH